MTSEIAVLNQRAVALAADSAVTLVDGGLVAVRNDQRKLFNLIEGKPIGLMFFGVADVMGHPWEQLIDHYQTKVKPGAFPRVADYGASFLGSLDNLEEFFPRARQGEEYKRLLASVFRYVFHFAQYLRDSGEGEGGNDAAILDVAIERVWRTYQVKEDGSPRADLACFPKDFGRKIASEYASVIEETIAYGFSQFGLAKQSQQRLRDIAVYCVVKDLFLEDVTGLVFSGFGSEERYPVVATIYMSAIVGGIAKRGQPVIDAIDGDTRSRIRVYADSEVTNAFIRGIDFNLERRLYGGFRVVMQGLVDQLIESLPVQDAAVRENVRGRFQREFVPRYFDALHRMISDYQQQAFINPILRVLEIAAKNELAETARDLVGLNVFKKRITAQKQTVGGAIDVATISRENGFQWYSKQGGG
jgi:hypothetical protein